KIPCRRTSESWREYARRKHPARRTCLLDAGCQRCHESRFGVEQMKPHQNSSVEKCGDHGGNGPTVYDLPVPIELREEWRRLATRRHFLGKMGKTLGWASLVTLLGDALTPGASKAATDLSSPSSGDYVPDFAPKAKR